MSEEVSSASRSPGVTSHIMVKLNEFFDVFLNVYFGITFFTSVVKSRPMAINNKVVVNKVY